MENALNFTDAANYLGIHKSTIDMWGRKGKIKIIRDKYNIKYISMEEIEKFKVPEGLKRCSKCELCKSPDDFSNRQSVCKTCRARPYDKKLVDGIWVKKCLFCNEVKPEEDFDINTKCKDCKRKQSKEWKENNPEKVKEYSKNYHIEHKEERAGYDKERYAENKEYRRAQNMCWQYKITMEELEALKEKSNGKCGICGTPDFKLSLDHDHSTNKPREFLCPSCNFGIGAFKENLESLQNAISYLQKHQPKPPSVYKQLVSIGDGLGVYSG